jgi:hypothetical protein
MGRVWIILTLALVLLFSGVALAQSGYGVNRYVVSGIGDQYTGDGYTLNGSAGQSTAQRSVGDGYTLTSGFWAGSESPRSKSGNVYLPLVTK